MAIYYVTGIWKDGNSVITHINAHEVDNTTVNKARKLSVVEVLSALKFHEFYTAKWGYAEAKWFKGAKIHTVNEKGQVYLRSNHDIRVSDNLDNMLPMGNLGC